jgi:hypothetical protein
VEGLRFVPLYGSALWDKLACARDIVLATSDGLLRIVGDRHYATDVLAGAAIGFGFGYGMPTILHYGVRQSSSASWMLSPMLGSRTGLVFAGSF